MLPINTCSLDHFSCSLIVCCFICLLYTEVDVCSRNKLNGVCWLVCRKSVACSLLTCLWQHKYCTDGRQYANRRQCYLTDYNSCSSVGISMYYIAIYFFSCIIYMWQTMNEYVLLSTATEFVTLKLQWLGTTRLSFPRPFLWCLGGLNRPQINDMKTTDKNTIYC